MRRRVALDVGEDAGVVGARRRGGGAGADGVQRRLPGDVHGAAHPLDQRRPVLLGDEVVVQDPRLGRGHAGAQLDEARARRAQQAGRDRPAVDEDLRRARLREQDRDVVQLDVGGVQAVVGAEEPARLGEVGGQRPAALGGEQPEVLLALGAEQRRLVGGVRDPGRRVVLEPLADGQLVRARDVDQLQVGGGPDARAAAGSAGSGRRRPRGSPRARPRSPRRRPSRSISTPVARMPSSSTRLTWAPVISVRFSRPSTGCR